MEKTLEAQEANALPKTLLLWNKMSLKSDSPIFYSAFPFGQEQNAKFDL